MACDTPQQPPDQTESTPAETVVSEDSDFTFCTSNALVVNAKSILALAGCLRECLRAAGAEDPDVKVLQSRSNSHGDYDVAGPEECASYRNPKSGQIQTLVFRAEDERAGASASIVIGPFDDTLEARAEGINEEAKEKLDDGLRAEIANMRTFYSRVRQLYVFVFRRRFARFVAPALVLALLLSGLWIWSSSDPEKAMKEVRTAVNREAAAKDISLSETDKRRLEGQSRGLHERLAPSPEKATDEVQTTIGEKPEGSETTPPGTHEKQLEKKLEELHGELRARRVWRIIDLCLATLYGGLVGVSAAWLFPGVYFAVGDGVGRYKLLVTTRFLLLGVLLSALVARMF